MILIIFGEVERISPLLCCLCDPLFFFLVFFWSGGGGEEVDAEGSGRGEVKKKIKKF